MAATCVVSGLSGALFIGYSAHIYMLIDNTCTIITDSVWLSCGLSGRVIQMWVILLVVRLGYWMGYRGGSFSTWTMRATACLWYLSRQA